MKIQNKICVIVLSFLAGLMLMESNEAMAAEGDVVINATNFPDNYVREAVKKKDSNKDGVLSKEEIAKITQLEIRAEDKKEKIYPVDLTGVRLLQNLGDLCIVCIDAKNQQELEQLPNLSKLGISFRKDIMGKIDFSNLKKVKDLWVYAKEIGEIVLPSPEELEKLEINTDNTTNTKPIDLSPCSKLKKVVFYVDKMDKFILSAPLIADCELILKGTNVAVAIQNMPSLTNLRIKEAEKVKKVSIKNCPVLKDIKIRYCKKMEQLQMEQLPELTKLSVKGNKNVTKLDVSTFEKLGSLELVMPKLKTLKIPKNPKLYNLDIDKSQLSKLDFTKMKDLCYLNLGSEKIKQINLTKCPKLVYLTLSDMKTIESLKIPKLNKLYSLEIFNLPKLKKLDITKCPNLNNLAISGLKSIKTLNLSKQKKITELRLMYMKKLKKVIYPKAKKLKEFMVLSCQSLRTFGFDKFSNLKTLDVSKNYAIKHLNVSKLKKLDSLEWTNGKLKKITWGKHNKIRYVSVNHNQLSGTLDLRKLPSIDTFQCYDNKYTYLEGGKKICLLYCEDNKLKTINLKKAKNLVVLSCVGNKKVKVYMPDRLEDGPNADKSAKIIYPRSYR